MSNDWSNGLCSCFGDCTTCIVSFIVPCYTFGKNAEQLGESCVTYGLLYFVGWYFFQPLAWFFHAQIRGKIRDQRGIEGSCLNDFLCAWFCYGCALTQEARELRGPGGMSMARE